MSVLLETSLGDLVIDLEVDACPELSENFLKVRIRPLPSSRPIASAATNPSKHTTAKADALLHPSIPCL